MKKGRIVSFPTSFGMVSFKSRKTKAKRKIYPCVEYQYKSIIKGENRDAILFVYARNIASAKKKVRDAVRHPELWHEVEWVVEQNED
jgi:hypothetical protein